MIIEILGTGCPKCRATKENVKKVAKELGLGQQVEVRDVKDVMAIASKGVMLTHGVIVDGTKVSGGRVPSPEEVKGWIKERDKR
ncbi:MAG: thioredoxin family protein [Dehalococcoidales bacterium]|nr:thioredoxin family protein [Dehalococcoidales bacterium]